MKGNNKKEDIHPSDNWNEIVNALEASLLIVGSNFNVIDINESGLKLFQKSKAEIVGEKCYDLIKAIGLTDKDCTLVKSSISKKTEQREIFEPGLKKWLQIKTSPVLNNKGEVLKYVEVITDITELKNKEAELKESEERFRLLHENAGLGIGYYTPDGFVISFNEKAIKDMGGKPEDYLNKHIYDIFPKEAADTYMERIKAAVASDNPSNYEDFVLLPTGNYWFLSTVVKIVDSNNKTVGVQIISSEISEQKKVERALIESETLLKEAQKIGSIGNWKRDLKTNKRTWSEELYQNYGLDPNNDPPEFSTWIENVVEEDRELLIYAHKRAFEDKESYNITYRFKRFDNDKIEYINSRGTAHFNKNGKADYLYGIDQNVTAQKTAENLIIESEEKYRALYENAPLSYQSLDINGKIIDVNPTWLTTLGYKREDVIGKCFGDLVHKDYVKQFEKKFPEFKRTGYVSNVMFKLYRKDNTEIFVSYEGCAGYAPDGSFKQTYCTFKDITNEIKAKKVAEESEEKFKLLAENIPMVTYLCKNNKDWTMLYLNKNIEKLVGYENTKFTDENLKFAKLCHPDDLDKMYQKIDNSINGNNTFYLQYRLKHKLGKWIWVEEFGVGFKTKDGEDLLVGSINNITDRLKNEKELLLAKEKAEESDRLKTAFLANMSHEIRTPMNGILGFSELLKEPKLSTDQQKNYIEIIEESGHRMLNIINDLIDISKIEAGQMDMHISSFSLKHQLDYINTFFKPEAFGKNLNLIFNNNSDFIIETDKEKFLAILVNLVRNAIKYTNKGSIEVSYTINKRYFQFSIKDTGIGIQPEKQKSIFERFVQADLSNTKPYEGAGLGLAISKAYVNMLGGEIWVDSEIDKGTVFYFTIPVTGSKKEIDIFDEKEMSTRKENLPKKISILIVDDDVTSQIYLSEIVKSYNGELIVASSGMEAIEICKSNKNIDVILMDIKMPEMDGYSTTKEIRKINPLVFVIAQTAYAIAGDKEKILMAGFNDYISKPVQKNELLEKINKGLI